MNPYRRFTSYWWRHYWYMLTGLHRITWHKLGLLWDYGPVLWRDADYSETYLYRLMLVKFGRMRRHTEQCRIVCDWKKQAREYMICETLLRRLIADEYVNFEDYVSSGEDDSPQAWAKRRREWKYEEAMRKQDLWLLCKLIERKSATWWD